MDVGLEFHSLSKTFSMTGWRIAFAAGNSRAVAGLGKIKTNIDSGAFQAVQVAGIEAMKNFEIGLEDRKKVYQDRINLFCKCLDEAGLDYTKPKATFIYGLMCRKGFTSSDFAAKMLEESGIVVTPG